MPSRIFVPGTWEISSFNSHISMFSTVRTNLSNLIFCVTPEQLEMHSMHQQNKLPMNFASRDSFDQ